MAATHAPRADITPHQSQFSEDLDGPGHPNPGGDGTGASLTRALSNRSVSNVLLPSRGGTLKKKASLSRKGSLKRSGSRRNSFTGSMRSLRMGDNTTGDEDEMYSALYTPVPTSGSPTEILADRFQGWRKVLKDLVTYFREVQTSYEQRSKALLKVTNIINNITLPTTFVSEGGINEATHILRDYHRKAFAEGNKAKEMETGVINQLTGLRADLSQKIKEIKGLSGDFKNSVQKEMEITRRAIQSLKDTLDLAESDPSAAAGKGDPFIVKLAVEKQVERQIDEENYLHRAFLNLESSGRELDSIIVGEIQKAYNAYAGILKREADETYEAVDRLRSGPIAMPKDFEWTSFVEQDERFIDPRIPLRDVQSVHYPGRTHLLAAEVRAGMLERKSKYLKSYTPGWYVLTATHLHEFKSADRIHSQTPVMSLYLPEQKLGTHSQPDSSSHKFMLKGRQTGTMHRGHSWVFRAESHDTMLAWYEDLMNLTSKTGAERNAFVRQHARTSSNGSHRAGSISSDGALEEDEADQVPYSANTSSVNQAAEPAPPPRPSPGGRFPSDLQVNRGLHAPLSVSSDDSDRDRARNVPAVGSPAQAPGDALDRPSLDATIDSGVGGVESPSLVQQAPVRARSHRNEPAEGRPTAQKHDSVYGDWMGPVGARTAPRSGGVGSESQAAGDAQEMGSGTPAPRSPDDEGTLWSAGSTRPRETTMSTTSQVESASTLPTTIDHTLDEGNGTSMGTGGVNISAEQAKSLADAASKPTYFSAAPTSGASPAAAGDKAMHVPGEFPPTPVI
ncbi:MAG: hypothetical protein M1838_005161 [Thelocarpon superellum]|nr:MAG: hypothetical protein M1838_005161 [Thelocarpon superellum]